VRPLEDIQIIAAAGVLPMTISIGFSEFFVSRTIEKGVKRKNVDNVTGLLDVWNERIFQPSRKYTLV
jgi:hypothetical protein